MEYVAHAVVVVNRKLNCQTIVATALPSIMEELQSAGGYAWVGSAYLLAVTALLPLWGTLSDVWGRKLAILLANGVFFAGSLICALSINMAMLIAGRAVQGVGAAGLVLLVNVILSDMFPIKSEPYIFNTSRALLTGAVHRERAKYMGIVNTSWAIAAAIGPLVGGAFAEKVTWRWCFYVNLPLNGVVFILLLLCLRSSHQRVNLLACLKSIDWLGVLLIIGGTLMLLLGLQFGSNTDPWNSPTVICLIVFGLLVMATFIAAEWYVETHTTQRPIVPLALFRHRSPSTVLLCFWIHGIIGIAPYYFLPLFFQIVRGATPILSGVYVLPMVLTAAVTTMATGIFAQVSGYIVEPIWAGFILSTLGLGLFINFDEGSSWPKLILYQLVFGLGLGPNYSAPLLAVQRVVKPADIAAATSTVAFSRQLGSSLSLVIGGSIFQAKLKTKMSDIVSALGSEAAANLADGGAEASTRLITGLNEAQKSVVRSVYADSLRPMYYVYVALSGLALIMGFVIQRGKLEDTPTVDANTPERDEAEKGGVDMHRSSPHSGESQ